MRTTIDIDDNVLARIKIRAKHEHRSAGRVISDLLREQLERAPEIVMKSGVPVIHGRPGAQLLSQAEVASILDKLLLEETGL